MFNKAVLVTFTLTCVSFAYAEKPAVAYTEAGKFDSSFNEAVYRDGVAAYKSRYNVEVMEKHPSSPDQYVPVLTDLARSGRGPIVAVGYSYAPAIEEVAGNFPNVQFTILDAVVDLPNVQSIVFKEHEGSFLVGALAALKSKDGNLGFVGGVDTAFIKSFACGYAQGAHYIDSKSKVHVRSVADDYSGFSNKPRGEAIAEQMISEGIDVIYAAAGESGNGVYHAAAQHSSVYAIGVDSNQNYLHPGTMLTSMVKRVGVAAFGSWDEAREGNWSSGIKLLGLAENGVDWQIDIFNRNLVTVKQEERINEIRDDIISGKIEVVDYLDTINCPVTMIID